MRLIVAWLLLATAAAHAELLTSPPPASKAVCDDLQIAERFDCFPEAGATQESCEARGCCWAVAERILQEPGPVPKGAPWCFYPRSYGGYEAVNASDTPTGQLVFMKRTFPSPYPNDIQLVKVEVEYQTISRVRIKISDALNDRFEAPYPKISATTTKAAENPNYRVKINTDKPGIEVTRKNGSILFSARDSSAFIFADQFLQISTYFEGHVYGLGEHRTALSLDTNWTILTMFNRDVSPTENTNLYGSHPFYLVVDPNGLSHGIFLHNSNAMDVILQPLPAVTFRAIGGILDIYIFEGPTPSDVIKQYTELIGRPFFPPYWSLGFQLCKWGYGSEKTTREVWQRNRDKEIPFDVQWNDIDYMLNFNDFTIDPVTFGNLTQLVQDIHDAGMHYVPILDPGVSAAEPSGTYPPYDEGIAKDIFVKNSDGSVFIGRVWNPVSTAYPDFTHPNATNYWASLLQDFYEKVKFDGIWIDMNEPSNNYNGQVDGCPESNLETPPFVPRVLGDVLQSRTLCMTAKHYAGDHYNIHNLYSTSQAEVTSKALQSITGKRGFVLSRATFPGIGAYSGHWGGDDASTWYDMAKSIPEILTSNMYGMTFTGADICGFNGETNHNLCNRWTQLGAFYPFSRNHNAINQRDQDPAAWDQDLIDSAKKALRIRYSLLPHLYTLYYQASVNGETVARPLFFEFSYDVNTLELDKSFLWGSGLLIVPVLEDNADSVRTYLPEGRWYNWYTQQAIDSQGSELTLSAPFDTIPLLIRGGNVLPTQAPEVTTTLSRKNGFTFLVASDANGGASGTLFWDDGESLDTLENNQFGLLNLALSNKRFTSEVQQWNTDDTPSLQAIRVLGVSGAVNEVTLNGNSVTFELNDSGVLNVDNINSPLNVPIDLAWN